MSLAATVVSIRDVRAEQARRHRRARMHERLDELLDEAEDKVTCLRGEGANVALIDDLVREVKRVKREITKEIMDGLVHQASSGEDELLQMPCPTCKRLLRASGKKRRTIETLEGSATLNRPYFYCVKCRRGIYPADARLGVEPGRKQRDMKRLAAKFVAEMPYEAAAELFEESTGMKMSTDCMHEATSEVTEGLGLLDVAPSAEEILARVNAATTPGKPLPVVVCAIDGAMVPTRPDDAAGKRRGPKNIRARRAKWKGLWKEAKGVRFYLISGGRIVHLLSWHRIQTDEELFASIEEMKQANLLPLDRIRLCVVADGARWIWKQIKAIFPTARQVLDYYHCSEHVHEVAALKYGEGSERASEWSEATLTRLYHGDVALVVAGLRRMRDDRSEVAKKIDGLVTYLERNAERIDFKNDREAGYPLGSGGIESAHKFIAHVRLKRSGAWWYKASSDRMLALRCARYNGTYDRVFARHEQRSLDKTFGNSRGSNVIDLAKWRAENS